MESHMNWLQILVMVFGNAAWILPVFFWVRGESREDFRKLDEKIDANSKETARLIDAIRQDSKDFQERMYLETKDFHGRLCSIEQERNRKLFIKE